MALFKLLHLLSVAAWVGGMFFAYVVLRSGIGQLLKLPERMRLWDRVLGRFFKWVWLAIFLLLASGFYLIYLYGGMEVMPRFVYLMTLGSIVMMLVFGYMFFACYVRFNMLVEEKEWHQAEAVLVTLQKLMAVNLAIGLLTIAVEVVGKT
jgi:uncharacterized membrane protein